ncbi:SRPBCC family protein [Nocardioides sp. HDW12B]|uniref:SRPBCC family protein n=1 Tax=Nocardioides sp. HDW12B TaxID=2714939 RepID=UPI0014093258|nr:SRPBCC family protein [Nocardioides sp. HDW12B]QIK65212.1 SRPBCC family protein [Nocardioides sp. HDW12B]
MDLNHTFTVPADKATAWAAFEDISSVAECFPGAKVTSFEGDEFTGTCKVKLGPIALQYSGQGSFIERDAEAGKLVFDAKGRDKRGNGTAGAKVTATFHEEGPTSTRVDVHTDMQITGKPAQFGRGVMQDVSDKLLEQFVVCLQSKVGAQPETSESSESSASSVPEVSESAPAENGASPEAVPSAASESSASVASAAGSTAPGANDPAPAAGTAPRLTSVGSNGTARAASPAAPAASNDDALDLGATVLPILLKSYGKQIGIGIAVLVVLKWLLGRR